MGTKSDDDEGGDDISMTMAGDEDTEKATHKRGRFSQDDAIDVDDTANLDTGDGNEKKEENDEGDEDTVTEHSHTADHENSNTTAAATTMVTCTVVELQALLHQVVQKAVHKAKQRTKNALQRMQESLVQDMQQREQRLVQYIGTKVTALEQTQLFALDPAAAAVAAAAVASTPGRHESNNAAGMMTSPVLAPQLPAAAVAVGATVANVVTSVGGQSESPHPTFRRNWVVNYNALKDFVHKNGRYPLLNETKAKVGRDEAATNAVGEGVGEGNSDDDGETKKKRKRGDTPADLGQWVINQRRVYHKTKEGTMTPQKLQQLEALPNWTWSKPRAGSKKIGVVNV